MSEFIVTLLDMSLVSCWLILALILLRPLLKKAPGALVCALWGLVGLRLICPLSIESIFSFIPSAEPVRESAFYTQVSTFSGSEGAILPAGNATNTLVPPAGTSISNPLQAISLVAASIWAVGFAVMLIISLVSYLRLSKNISASVNVGDNVFINDDIASPFVLGIFKPRIYLPSSLSEEEKEFVIAHENAHIKRRDYLIKPLGYLILSLHWFNPLVWVAYILLCRDIESACDERVISKMSDENKIEYSRVLLRLSVPNKSLRACPVAFGEVGVKMRIKSVLNYKKPAFWIIIVAAVLVVALTVGFLTNPISEKKDETQTDNISAENNPSIDQVIIKAISDNNKTEDVSNRFAAADYRELKTITLGNSVISYIWAYYGEYENSDTGVDLKYEQYVPAIVRMYESKNGYNFESYNAPLDYHYTPDVKAMFPEELHSSVMYKPGYYSDQRTYCMEQAIDYYKPEDEKIHNDFYPIFNAKVEEITDDYVVVAPFKGEKVSNNSFEKVRLNTNKLISDLSEIYEGDNVQVRYADIITIDTDPPTLTNVYHITRLKTEYQVLTNTVYYYGVEEYNLETHEYDPSALQGFVLPILEIDERLMTYSLYYMNYDVEHRSDAYMDVIFGEFYENDEYDEIILTSYDNETDVLCFQKIGDVYQYSAERSARYGGKNTGIIEDGMVFVSSEG